jgi:hypothetical protein
MTLAVHPFVGAEITVLQSWGSGLVAVQMPDGQVRHVPTTWTSLRPSGSALRHGEIIVVLEPCALAELARWVDARCKKVGPGSASMAGTPTDGRRTHQAGARGPAALVEQAGAPRARRSSRRGISKRGQ